ncbi:hypothetical protein ScPMuIL_011859 [Solemya velum]
MQQKGPGLAATEEGQSVSVTALDEFTFLHKNVDTCLVHCVNLENGFWHFQFQLYSKDISHQFSILV